MLTRRRFILSFASLGFTGSALGQAIGRNPGTLCSSDTLENFSVFIFGRNDQVRARQQQYQSGLRAFFRSTYSQLKSPIETGLEGRRSDYWARQADRVRDIEVYLAPSKNGIGFASYRSGRRAIYIDEGLIDVSISMSYAFAHLENGLIGEDEYLYFVAHLIDALYFGDTIPHVRGYNRYFDFIFSNDIISPEFFTSYHSCFNSIMAFVIFHECGHWELKHHDLFRTGELPDSSVVALDDWTNQQLKLSRELEAQADAYSIEICTRGLLMDTSLGVFNWSLFNLMRRNIMRSRGFNVYATHPETKERFESGLKVVEGRAFFDSRTPQLSNLFDRTQALVEEILSSREIPQEFDFGEFSASEGLPEGYYRFYRRNCNLRNYKDAFSISGNGISMPSLTAVPENNSLKAWGACHIGEFQP